MAVYSLYISRISHLNDFTIGTPILNRTNFDQKHTIGMFISIAPLRITLQEETSFADFAKEISTNTMSIFRHQKYSYQTILEDIRKKSPSIPSLYNILLSYQITKTTEESNGVHYYTDWTFNGNSSDELQIHLFDLNEKNLTVAYDYKSNLFSSDEIAHLHTRILTMIEQIVAAEEISLKEIEIVTPEEKRRLLYDFNNTAMEYPRQKTVIDLLEEQVVKTPDNIAVIFEDQKLTYRKLNKRVNQLARYLIENKVKAGDIVGIMLYRCPEMLIGILATLKVGATYLPIDPNYPTSRISYMLSDSNAKTVLVHSATASLEVGTACQKINIDINLNHFANENINLATPEGIIYLIYTSGSTGNPKGVMITHQNIVNFILGEKEHISFDIGKVMVSVTTICFDIFALELWGALTSGIPLVLANDIEQVTPVQLKDLCMKHHVTMMQTTPSRYSTLLTDIHNKDEFWNQLTDIMVGGEPFPKLLLDRLSTVTKAKIFNMYGPTETTVWSTIKDLSDSTHITIGKPIANTTCYILDHNKNLLPIGVSGELYIGGDGVAKGYWNREELTEEKFIKSPFSDDEIIYNTGDLAYFDHTGELVHLGRNDSQIKIRGYRIELEEIENKILEFPSISHCVVNPVNSSTKLCAYYISNQEIDLSDLKATLSDALPNYMVPNYFIRMEAFPYTPNGKIDRKSLPTPKVEVNKEVVSARNDLDTILVNILKDLLKLEVVDIETSIYDLGGDSLTSIGFVTEIYNELGISITVNDIVKHPTIKELSDHLTTLSEKNTTSTIQKVEKKKYYPASSAQKRMYYASSMDNNSVLYNIAGGIIVDNSLDISLLKQCFQSLINRNEALRTHFEMIDNEIVQIIEDKIDFTLSVDTLEAEDPSQVYHDFVKPFDLAKAPLFRAKITTLKDHKMLLLLDMHHIISDGTSLNILLQELCDLYNGKVLSEKQVDYKDFTLWEKEQFEKEEMKTSKDFWVNQYQDEIPLLNMPTTYSRPSAQSFEGSNYHTKFSKETFEKINTVAKSLGITPYMLLLASYYILLAKYTSQNDIVIGTPVVGRELPELSNMIGMFVNTLALRSKIDQTESFKDFANSLKEYCLAAFQNQTYPFDELVKELNIKRSTSRSPLFDVMFAYQNNGYPTIDFQDTQIEYFIPDNNISKFDLTLEIIPMNSELLLRFEYCTKLFDKAFIESFSSHYANILNAILENADIKIADIDMLSREERQQILVDFNDTYVDYPCDKTIVDLFEEQVEKSPDHIAVVFEKEQLTYRELNEKANQLANVLLSQGVCVGDVVGIFLPRSPEFIISIFGILKAGAAYMPMFTNYPTDRLAYMLDNSNAKCFITTTKLSAVIDTNLTKITINTNSNSEKSLVQASPNILPDDLAYVIYTSGSTGKPKGVKICHKNLINFVYAFNQYYKNVTTEDSFLASTNISFDVSVWEIFMSLLNGAKLVLNTEEIISDINLYCKNIIEHKITALYIPPNILNEVYSLLSQYKTTYISKLLVGVEPIKKSTLNNYYNLNKDLIIVNGYGPTETTICATALTYTKDTLNDDIVSIGRPLCNNQIYIVNPEGNLCPIGIPGELCIAGAGVGNGYLNNESETNKLFVTNPFSLTNVVLYKTGDLAKWNLDGTITFIGRIDNQVKISGYRIELNEINNCINQYESVSSVFTTLLKNSHLVSYFIAKSTVDTKELSDYLRSKLPFYMVPKFLMQLESFPLTPNGKIDAKKLPLPMVDTNMTYVAPENELEEKIAQILEALLGTDKLSTVDSLFDFGMDSLIAIRFSVKILEDLNISVGVNDIFAHPTIKELSDYIATLSEENTSSIIQKAEKREYYPVSSAQKRIYYASSVDSNSILYNISGGIIVDKPLDISLLKQCFQTLIDRNEVLRTRFDMVNGELVQIIEDKIDFTLSVDTLETEDLSQVYHDFVKPFDLAKAPLFRAKAVTLKDHQMLLLLDMHHIISDGTSLSILLQELCDLYKGKILPEKQVDYKDFALWEKKQFEKEEFKISKDFWINQYPDEIPLLNMPTTYPRPSTQSFEGSNYHTNLPKETFDKVNTIAKTLGITPYMLLLSSYYILLAKYTSQNDIVIGTPIVGRELPELSNMLGMFVNTLALRRTIHETESFKDFASSLKEYCLTAFEHQTYPFDQLDIRKDTSRNSLLDIMFVYQNNGYPTIEFEDVNATYFIPDSHISKFDLTLEVVPTNNEFALRFEYCTKLFDEAFIKKLSCHYMNILNAILENVDTKIADIDMLSEEEKHQILYEFNNRTLDYPCDKTLIDLFKEQVIQRPNCVAVSNTIEQITYYELDKKSNYLASQLYAQGVRSGDVVGVCLNRSIELLVSIWAIIKLGAAYMPMYIGYPTDRLQYMLSNSKAKMLITNSHLCTLLKSTPQIIINHFTDIDDLDKFSVDYPILPNFDAYVIYTSGSTGKPKGVRVSHQNLINHTYNFRAFYKKVDETDTFLASANISFDASIWELFFPLLNGSKLVLNKEELLNNIIDYCDTILSEKVTALFMPPNILNEIAEVLKNSSDIKISKLLVGVESIKKETLNKFLDLNEDMIIANGYGPTEATICTTVLIYEKDLSEVNSFVSIGHPICNTEIYILNKSLQHQPIGIPGEIYIGGDGVGNGYLNNPEANERSFVQMNGKTLYKSGDLAKWANDGTIEFIGRIDNQIKLNGYRIELNEITSVMMTYPNINKCHTMIVKNRNVSHLVAYFTSDSNISIKDLRSYLQSKLTFYMVPKFLIQIDAFPITENGKINYRALPEPNYESEVPFVAPRNDFEKKISKILCNLLNLDQVSIDENFFDIGCDSIIAIKFQLEALKENISISYGDIFQYPTIRMLSEDKNNSKDSTSFEIDANYDYTSIHNLLSKNKTYLPANYEKVSKNTTLLLGSTGFLGAHILDSYFSHNPDNTLYCIVRRKSLVDPSDRLKKTLNYYFGTKYDDYFVQNKIIVIEGDICQKYFGLSIEQLNNLMDNIDIVINSAALVKHYGDYETFSKINIDGTKSIVAVCKEFHKKLYHVSTLSVSGLETPNSDETKKAMFDECSFYINQQFNNVYIYTKFEAEKSILEEIENGLNATILRVGNLSNRFSDGLFQMNVSENAFVNRLKSLLNLQAIPSSFMEHHVEFTPVDLCANAIMKIANTNHPFSVLHLYNTELVGCKELLEYINHFGYPLQAVSDNDFKTRVTNYLNTDALKNSITGIVTDLNPDKTLNYISTVELSANTSNLFLNSIGFHWPILDEIYFKKYLEFFKKIDYFTQNKED